MMDRQSAARRPSGQGHGSAQHKPVVSPRLRSAPDARPPKGLAWKYLQYFASYAALFLAGAWAYLGGVFSAHSSMAAPTIAAGAPGYQLLVAGLLALVALAHLGHRMARRAEQRARETNSYGNRPRERGIGPGRTVHDEAVAWRDSRRSRREPLPEPPRPAMKPASEPDAGVWAWRGKLSSYLKACLAYLSALFFLLALGQGRRPIHDPLTGLGMIIPGAYLAIVMIPIVVPAILFLSKMASRHAVPRGIADIAIGAALNAIYLVPAVTALLSKGQPPALNELWHCLASMAAGAVGGFMFWRAEGYPGAAQNTAPPAADAAAMER